MLTSNRFDRLTEYECAVLSVAVSMACEWIEAHDNGTRGKALAWATLRDLKAELEGQQPLVLPLPVATNIGVN